MDLDDISNLYYLILDMFIGLILISVIRNIFLEGLAPRVCI